MPRAIMHNGWRHALRPLVVLCLVVTLPTAVAAAVEAPARGARVGDLAPPLTVERWLKGEPVDGFASGKVYVIDIWAPWCGPCIGSMPELSALQERDADRGLVVIGLTGADDYGSTLEKAQKVLEERADQVRYRIAWDHERETWKRWMALESGSGWPWCFVVDRDRRVAYVGHPSRLSEVLEPILAGTWNLDSARTAYAHRARGLELADSFMTAYRADRFPEARGLYGGLRAHDAALAGDYAAAMFKMLRIKMSRRSEAESFAREAAATMSAQHVGTLVRNVEMILDPSSAADRADLALALDLAVRARSMAGPHDAGAISTLAEVRFRRGETTRAIETQREAIAAAAPEDRAPLEKTLERYRGKTR